MLKRILLAAVVALGSPVPLVWFMYNYGIWLTKSFQNIGLNEKAAEGFAGVFCWLLVSGFIFILTVWIVFNTKKIVYWIKTGEYRRV